MKVTEVHFNHDTSSHSSDALNIRQDERSGSLIVAPEWQEAQPAKPAAYAAGALGGTITVKARFADGPRNGSVDIRAVDTQTSPPGNGGCAGILVALLHAVAKALTGNVLGEPKARSVAFDGAGVSELAEFELDSPTVASRPVGINHTSWRWEALNDGRWTDIGTTQHKIYVVLDTPTAPWQQLPSADSNKQLPWARALEYACGWAVFQATALDATTRLTERINGHPSQSYTPATMFGSHAYLLSDYLDALDSGTPFVMNCTDCADATTTLANLLGADQVEGRFFNLDTWPFLTLGGDASDPADWGAWSWNYHETSWVGAMGTDEHLFDACLQLDVDPNHGDAVHTPKLPTDMRFGTNGANDYRYWLVQSGAASFEGFTRRRSVA